MATLEALATQVQELATQVQSMKANYNRFENTTYNEQVSNYDEALDTLWMVFATCLVFFMHTGFSLLESGVVRMKNTQHILTKNLIVVTCGFLCWYVFGFSAAFGEGDIENRFIGSGNHMMADFWADKQKFRFWLFQGAFCSAGATIVSGAMAERTRLAGFSVFTFLMTSLFYPVVVYWGWSGYGFLNYTSESGEAVSSVGPAVIDFAGSGMVHLVGGTGALCGAFIVGPRLGRWDPSKAAEFEGHNIPYCVLGTLFLWFGWYGFNAGSTGSMKTTADAYVAGLVAVNTTLSPCVAGLVVFLLRAWFVAPKLLDVGGFCNGILAGLVSITAPCAVVEPSEAIVIGLLGGAIYQGASMLVRKLGIDDVVDAYAVHGACGLWGLLAAGLFGNPSQGMEGNGAIHGGNQLFTQIFAGFMIILWVGGLSVLTFTPLHYLGLLRVPDDVQEQGADTLKHTPATAYGRKEAEEGLASNRA